MIPWDFTLVQPFGHIESVIKSVTAQLDDHISSLLLKCSVASHLKMVCSLPTFDFTRSSTRHLTLLHRLCGRQRGYQEVLIALGSRTEAVDAILQKLGVLQTFLHVCAQSSGSPVTPGLTPNIPL
jgi:hypothetical protein